MSQYFVPTLKETPQDAELVSHRYMLRAGLIRRSARGIYIWMPLGLRVLRHVEKIIRQEMASVGALEVQMPMVQPGELWQETGRWQQYGAELLRFKDRAQHDYCLGPTHEEVVTDLVRNNLSSYKQLPLLLFQIQAKFRDEIRPRFGVMRSREFIMKDAYSFHVNQDSLSDTYDKIYHAYERIFTRLGLKFRAVLADTGEMGGELSHEFQVLAHSGEDLIVFSDGSDYAANIERAESLSPLKIANHTNEANEANDVSGESSADNSSLLPMQTVDIGPAVCCEDIAAALAVDAKQLLKVVVVKGDDVPWVGVVLRADHELNPAKAVKLQHIAAPLQLATSAELEALHLPAEAMLIGLSVDMPTYVDRDVAVMPVMMCGFNKSNQYATHVVWGRDFKLPEVADLRLVVEGDASPDGKGFLHFKRGIEVGHIFQLGSKYSQAMQATVLDEMGKAQTLLSGCYGIGVSRIVAAAIEQNHDERGIIWPPEMAPFTVHLLPLMAHKSYRVRELAETIYEELTAAGIDVLWEDRKLRPGVMFAQADLLGIPHALIIGERGLEQQTLEYKARAGGEAENWPVAEYLVHLQKKMALS